MKRRISVIFFFKEEIIENSCGPTGINLNRAQNISESLPKSPLPASCDVYNSDSIEITHANKSFFFFSLLMMAERKRLRKKGKKPE